MAQWDMPQSMDNGGLYTDHVLEHPCCWHCNDLGFDAGDRAVRDGGDACRPCNCANKQQLIVAFECDTTLYLRFFYLDEQYIFKMMLQLTRM